MHHLSLSLSRISPPFILSYYATLHSLVDCWSKEIKKDEFTWADGDILKVEITLLPQQCFIFNA